MEGRGTGSELPSPPDLHLSPFLERGRSSPGTRSESMRFLAACLEGEEEELWAEAHTTCGQSHASDARPVTESFFPPLLRDTLGPPCRAGPSGGTGGTENTAPCGLRLQAPPGPGWPPGSG